MHKREMHLILGIIMLFIVSAFVLVRPSYAEEAVLSWLTQEEQNWLKNHPVVAYALDPEYAPFEFLDEDGVARGIQMDILELLEQELGIEIEIKDVGDWTAVLESVANQEVDIISATKTPERSKNMLFTDVYLQVPTGMIMHKNNNDIHTIDDLEGKRIATVKDWSWNEILRNEHPEYILVEYSNVKNALNAVVYNEVDAAIMDFGSASYHISINNITHLKVLGSYDRTDNISFGVRKDYQILVQILNKTFPRIEEGTDRVHSEWIKLDYDELTETKDLLRIAFIISAILIVVFLWNLSLRLQVNRKTKALQRELEKSEEMKREIESINERLRQSQVELETVLNADPSSIFVKDKSGAFVIVNTAAAKTLRLRPEKMMGKKMADFPDRISSASLDKMEKTEQEILNGEKAFAYYTVELFDGSGNKFTHEVRKVPIPGPDGSVEMILSVASDITELHNKNVELEESVDKLKSARAQLLEQEKWAAIGAFVAGIAHDVNTPLGSSITINSHLKKLLGSSKKSFEEGTLRKTELAEFYDDASESVDMLDRHLNQAADLIQNFKAVSVHQINEVEEAFDICAYIKRIAKGMKYECKKRGAAIQVHCSDEILYRGTPGLISQIMTNLISNSLTHGFDQSSRGHINIEVQKIEEGIQIDYRDDGKGMDKDTLEKVFMPFYTTKRDEGGSGLGMHIVHTLISEKLSGTIDVVSMPNEGVQFKIVLPTKSIE